MSLVSAYFLLSDINDVYLGPSGPIFFAERADENSREFDAAPAS